MISRKTQRKFVCYLSKFPKLQTCLTGIYHKFFRSHLEKYRTKQFQKRALSILKQFGDVMDEHNYFYTLAFGSMLGAVREKGFIKHDADIDVHMWIEDYSPQLINDLSKVGFTLAHGFEIEEGKCGQELTFEKEGVGIDVFFIYPPINQYPYCCDFITQDDCQNYEISMQKYGYIIPRRLEMPFVKERKKTEFENIQIYIPSNADILLKFRYGEDYMIPNSNWNIRSFDEHIIIWDGKKGIMFGE